MSLKEQFEEDGYVIIENAFDLSKVEDFEKSILRLSDSLIRQVGGVIPTDPYEKLRLLCRNYKEEFFQLCSHVGETVAGNTLCTSPMLAAAMRQIIGNEFSDYFTLPPVMFFNDRGSERLKYEFHQECTAFRIVKQAIHVWAPLFHQITQENGPMIVVKGSHKKVFPYRVLKAPNSVTQYYIDPKLLEEYEQVYCAFKRGSAIIFHHNMAHATAPNKLDIPRVAWAARFINLKDEPKFTPFIQYHFRTAEFREIADKNPEEELMEV